ncbi:hypothetical protein MRS44_001465 [Fusarium solani]|uniref:uncharacterized protein n=1 Tax=Fusarium solani TaxID=169388 RepID=UPI0032C45199|nr:hypothetical protein MRS44_001465 [Fusarium solani]
METDRNGSDLQRARDLESIKTKNIRTVTDLREILGFGRSEFDQSRAFKKAVKQFASGFIAEDGNPGPTFTRWSDSFHKKVFSDMARRFLEKHGREFWPDSPITQRLQYERDHAQLLILLAQLFFRQNELCQRKTPEKTSKERSRKAPNKPASVDTSESTTSRPYREGSTRETPIDLDDYNTPRENRSRGPDNDGQVVSPQDESNQPSSISNRVSQALDDSPERSPPDGSNMQPSPALHAQTEDVLPMEDIHDGSSALEVPASSSNTHGKRSAPPQFEGNDRQTKTPRLNQEHPNETENSVAEYHTSTQPEELTLTSGRVWQPLHRQGYIMGNECLERLEPYADNSKKKRQRTRGASVRGTQPPASAPVAVMALESVENHHDIDSPRHDASGDPFDGSPEASDKRFDCNTEHVVRRRSRSFTMRVMPDLGEGSLPEPDFQQQDEPNFVLQTSPGREQAPYQGREQLCVEMERRQSHQSDLDSSVNECRANTETDNITASTNDFNIDYTVYNDEEEPVSSWSPPRYFFAMSFDELVEALPLKRPRGLRLCLEGAVKRKGFSRTACDQERFKLHQWRFGEMMRSWEDEIASKGGPKPSFEIIIEPLK